MTSLRATPRRGFPPLVSSLRARFPRMSALRARIAAADPLVAVVGLTSLVVYVLHGFHGGLRRDIGVYMYGALRFLDGQPPYDGIMNRAGPLAHMLPAVGILGARLVGGDELVGARVFFMLISVGCVCLVYVLARDLLHSRGAALVAATGFLSFTGFLGFATYGPREKTAMVLFLLVAMIAVLHRRWATAGVFVALGTLTWQPVFFVAITFTAVAVILAPTGRLRAALRVVAGGAATTAALILYYATQGAVRDFFDGFVLINARYTIQKGASPVRTWDMLSLGYGWSLWWITLGLAALPVLSALAVRSARRTRDAAQVTLVAAGAGWAAGVAWAFVAFNGYPDLFVMLPSAALGLGGLTAAILDQVRGRGRRWVTVGTAIGLALAFTVFAADRSWSGRNSHLDYQRRMTAAVMAQAPPDATIVSVQAPEVLVLTHRTNPTRLQMFSNGFWQYVDATYPGGLDGYRAYLERTRPDFIVVQHLYHPRWLTPLLQQDYRLVGTRPAAWWVSNELGADVADRIHRAYRKVTGG